MCLYTMVLMMNEHPNSLLESEGKIGDEGTSNLGHPSFLPLPQTVVSKVDRSSLSTGIFDIILVRLLRQDPDTLDKAGGIEKKCV